MAGYRGPERRRAGAPSDAGNERRFKKIESDVQAMRRLIAENTKATVELVEKVESHRASTKPVVEAMDNMQRGIKIIGGIGDAVGWIIKRTWPIVALWAAVKYLFGGASWADAVALFWKVMGSKP